MATSMRRPLFKAVGLSSAISPKCFSQLRPLQALGNRDERAQKSYKPPMKKDRSPKSMNKELAQIPNDVGVMAHTFIPPSGENNPSILEAFWGGKQPSIFQTPLQATSVFRSRQKEVFSVLRFRWKVLLFKLRDLLSLVYFKYSSPKKEGKKWARKLQVNRARVVPKTLELHNQLYTLFAEGKIQELRRICCDGIFESFRTRISLRKKGEKLQWQLVKLNGPAKVVSHRAAKLPIEGGMIRQAVVRISSTQKLTRYQDGEVVEGTGESRDVVEHVVVQKRTLNWEERDWVIWGTTQETTMEEVFEWERELLE